ncbi:hypothetical protein [Devosia faecipullorum]|uniref:hypothetical protein n=1 Tax=Devosia faecipullorum TaxID=2755039 RepID=UPI00187B1ED6|nr:hypothetical protein [Devosia faecipullorum]MBE7732174.1 hypothetical protein [Devosia faecipullorum]
MLADIEIGTDDLVTVAVAAARDLLSGIEIDGKPIPVRMGQVYPEAVEDLPVLQVFSTSEGYQYGAGRVGHRMVRIDATITVALLFALPIIKLEELDRKIGRVRGQIKARIAADPHLKIDGKVWATDLEIQSIQKGLAGAGKATLAINQLQLGCSITHREGSLIPAHYN